jgi:hypothetical protein
MQRLKIDVTKIDKTAMFKGAKGTYLDLTLIENKDGRDQYDNDGFIAQDIGKERREAGEKGPIVGNWKHVEIKTPAHSSNEKRTAAGGIATTEAGWEDDSEIPF